jgi:hypothetical protein
MDKTGDILQHFGGMSKNNLLAILESTDDLESCISMISESPYVDTENICDYIKSFSHTCSLLSLNIQSLNSKYNQLQILVQLLSDAGIAISVICLQETWLTDPSYISLFPLKDYTPVVLPATCSTHGGLVIYIHNTFTFDIRNLYSPSKIWEGLFVDIFHESVENKLTVCNIYRPPRSRNDEIQLFLDEFMPVVDVLRQGSNNVSICGDFNIDLLQVDQRNKFSDYLDTYMTNGFTPSIILPTRFSERNATLIDHIFNKLGKQVTTKSCILFTSISDHLPCLTCFSFKKRFEPRPKYITIQKKNASSFANFYEHVSQTDFHSMINADLNCDPNINYSLFESKLNSLLHQHFPIQKVKYKKYEHKCSFWITNGIMKSLKFRDKLFRRLKNLKHNSVKYNTTKVNLHTYNTILNKTIRLAKNRYYTSQFNVYKGDSKKTWQVIKQLLNSNKHKKTFPNFFLIDNVHESNKTVIADRFNTFFANIGVQLSSQLHHNNVHNNFVSTLTNPTQHRFSFTDVTQDEVYKIISSFKPKLSSGPDGISMKLTKFIAGLISPVLSIIINQSLNTGIFPDALKIAKVLPLHKKDNTQLFDNYRPISLLPCFSKIFEKVVYNQIYDYFDKFKLFIKHQHGFRKKHSTETAALEFVGKILSSLENHGTAFSLFIDLSKAFDTISHDILLDKLHFYGIENTPLTWFRSYLSDRKQYVEYDGTNSRLTDITTGVPQGSVLGPLLFLIYVNDMSNISNDLHFVLYADDTSIESPLSTFECQASISGSSISESINNELKKLFDWLCVNKLTINLKKTKYMIFHCQQRHSLPLLNIEINGTAIERVQTFNFLGITLHENLTWKEHINNVCKKVSRNIGILRRLKSFTPTSTLLLLYKSLILPHLQYGILLWGHSCEKMVKLQKKAIRIICNLKYNAHTSAFFKKHNILKLKDLYHLNLLKFYFKYRHNNVPDFFTDMFNLPTLSHSHNTRNRNVPILPIPPLSLSKSFIKYVIPRFLISIPNCILSKIETHSLKGFSDYFKQHTIKLYKTVCTIANCHVCKPARVSEQTVP